MYAELIKALPGLCTKIGLYLYNRFVMQHLNGSVYLMDEQD